jgi:hypothetical protein
MAASGFMMQFHAEPPDLSILSEITCSGGVSFVAMGANFVSPSATGAF